jgi:hypothetical protein
LQLAKARDILERMPESVETAVNGNIIKKELVENNMGTYYTKLWQSG